MHYSAYAGYACPLEPIVRVCRLDEVTKFLMANWHQGDKPSRQEALRGTFDPGYLYYTIGLEILKLRTDYQAQEGANFSSKIPRQNIG